MADDWQPGDLALCVSLLGSDCPELTVGGVYTVAEVMSGWNCHGLERVGLSFGEIVPSEFGAIAFDAIAFRKIKPLTDAEREEALRDLKAPVREPAA